MNFYKQLLDDLEKCVLILDSQLNIYTFNKKFEKLVKIQREEAQGKSIKEIAPSPLPESVKLLIRTITEEKEFDLPNVIVRWKSIEMIMRIKTRLIYENGKLKGGIGYFYDVTKEINEKKQLEDKNKEINALFYESFNEAKDVKLLYKSTEGIPIFYDVNKAATELLGYSKEELLAFEDPHAIIFPPYLQDKVNSIKEEYLSKGRLSFEWEYLCKNGEIVPIEISASHFKAGQTFYTLVSARDISERKIAEKKLLEINSFYQRLFDSFQQGITITEGERFVYANDKVHELLSIHPTSENIKDKTFNNLYERTSKLFKEHTMVWEAIHDHNKNNEYINNIDVELVDGRTLQIDFLPIGSDGESIKNVWVCREISDQKEYERFLIQEKEKSEKANMEKNIFLSQMSHDIRTPLNSILGFSQMLLLNGKHEEESIEYIKNIINSGNHLLGLIDDMLEYTIIESGDIKLSIAPVDVFDVIEKNVNVLDILANDRGVKINVENNANNCYVYADQVRLNQVIQNLLTNAIKYNIRNGLVTVKTELDKDHIKIIIEDTGIGIAKHDLPYVFQPFFRPKNVMSSGEEGNGLGLAIVAKMTEKMNGTYGIHSTLGKGTMIWISLPIAENKEEKQKSILHHTQKSDELNILYIEDNQLNIKLMQQMVKKAINTKVNIAMYGKDGLKRASECIPDLILLDLGLPDIDGFEVLQQLKDQHKTRHIPIIVITADAMADTKAKAYSLGADAYLAKPIDYSLFVSTLTSILD